MASSLSFTLVDGTTEANTALYAPNTPAPAAPYYLMFDAGASPPAGPLAIADVWKETGSFVTVDEAPADAVTFAARLRTALVASATEFPLLAWASVSDPTAPVQQLKARMPIADGAWALAEKASLDFGRWQLHFDVPSTFGLTDDTVSIQDGGNSGAWKISVVYLDRQTGSPQNHATITDPAVPLTMPMTGATAGTISFKVNWLHADLQVQFGGDQRGFYDKDGGATEMVRYPLFTPPGDPGPQPAPDLFFDAHLNPAAPFDDTRTRLSLDVTKPNKLTSKYLRTTGGTDVHLVPIDPGGGAFAAGFGFSKSLQVPGLTTAEYDHYMCPAGPYRLNVSSGALNERIHLMCGVSGSEYVLAVPGGPGVGDMLYFESGQPALAKNELPPLVDTYTTSYVRVVPAAKMPPPPKLGTSYCAQAAGASYFGTSGAGYPYPVTVGCRLVDFHTSPPTLSFPLFSYGGVFAEEFDPDSGFKQPINTDLQVPLLQTLEESVWSPARWGLLEPVFDKVFGPLFFDFSNDTPFEGGYARTALGLIVELNKTGQAGDPPAGTWLNLKLAHSPQNPDDYLQFTSSGNPGTTASQGVVNPTLSNTLQHHNLFMVVSDNTQLGKFDNQIQLGDFPFQLDVAPLPPDRWPPGTKPHDPGVDEFETIMLFKFVTGKSIESLITEPSQWTSAEQFVGPPPLVEKIKTRLGNIIAEAKEKVNLASVHGDDADLFKDFLAKISDPNWTGIFALKCQFSYADLPLDIQMLLGGIKGQLLAHHFGITVNRITGDFAAGGNLDIQRSSLFALIHYLEAFDAAQAAGKPFDFQVTRFDAKYVNSKVTDFQSQIAMSAKKLFQNEATLSIAPTQDFKATNTIVINGTYLVHKDGTGELTFDTPDRRVFDFPATNNVLRVLQKQSVTDARLSAVAHAVTAPDHMTVQSAFKLAGQLLFVKPLGTSNLDLFSYGEPSGDDIESGLQISDYGFALTTVLNTKNNTAEPPGIDQDASAIKTDASSPMREESFAKSLRFQLAPGLPYSKDGLTGWGLPFGTEPIGVETAGAPNFMVEYDLQLGGLGALVGKDDKVAALIRVGWTPGGTAAKADEMSLFIRLNSDNPTEAFKVEGLLKTTFDSINVQHYAMEGGEGVFVIGFPGFRITILGLELLFFNASGSQLIVFANPGLKGQPSPAGNLVWFLASNNEETGMNWSIGTLFLSAGMMMRNKPIETEIVESSLAKLRGEEAEEPKEFIEAVYAGKENGAIKYAGDGGIIFGLDIYFMGITLQALFVDGYFYGGRIAVGEVSYKDKGKWESKMISEALEAAGVKGIEAEVVYRKINDHLGVLSFDIFVNIEIPPKKAGGDSPWKIVLPNVGYSRWTNGDWSLAIGWPLSSWPFDAHPFQIWFKAGPFPLVLKAGLYLASLRSEDVPQWFAGTNYQSISSLGIGVSGGLGKKGSAGPLDYAISLELRVIFQGIWAGDEKNAVQPSPPVNYSWTSVSLGIVFSLKGSVDLKIISASVSALASITATWAWETEHLTHLIVQVKLGITVEVHIIFFTIHFTWTKTWVLTDHVYGSGLPPAQLSGPTPGAIKQEAAMFMAGALGGSTAAADTVAATTGGAKPQIELSFLLQSTSVAPSTAQVTAASAAGAAAPTWTPQGVATLAIDLGTAQPGAASQFYSLATGLTSWLFANYIDGKTTLADQIEAILAALAAGQFDAQVMTCLADQFTFQITGTDPNTPPKPGSTPPRVGMFPMFSELQLTYGGTTTAFDDRKVPSNYEDIVVAYFDTAAIPAAGAAAGSMASAALSQYFVTMARDVIHRLQQEIEKPGATEATWQQALPKIDIGSVAGFMSRYLLGGIRLPDPAHLAPVELAGLYDISGQQFPFDEKVADVELGATAATPSWITFAGGKTAATSTFDTATQYFKGELTGPPPWQMSPVDPVTEVPRRFPMHINLSWTDGSDTNTICRFSKDLQHDVETWRIGAAASTDPYLLLQDLKAPPAGQGSGPLAAADFSSWSAASALVVPIQLQKIPDGAGFVADTYQLIGTDEATRALVQALLDGSPATTVAAMDLIGLGSGGGYATIADEFLLVKANLSTATAPGGGGGGATVGAPEPDGADCDGFAKISATSTDKDFHSFLRLVWECSIVHTGGFYLRVKGVDPALFKGDVASLMIVAQTTAASGVPQVGQCNNAVVGISPAAGSSIYATLASKADGTPVPSYTASYVGGDVGWQITWSKNVPMSSGGAAQLADLYHMASSRIVAGTDFKASNWSRPVMATNPDGATTWSYMHTFPTLPLLSTAPASPTSYSAIGKTVIVDIGVSDIYGNALPESMNRTVDLPVAYNDTVLGLGDWPDVNSVYMVKPNGDDVTLEVTLNYTTESDYSKQQLEGVIARYDVIRNQLEDSNMAAGFLAENLATGTLDTDVSGAAVKTVLVNFITSISTWLGDQTTPAPSPLVIDLPLKKDFPAGSNWPGDLQPLTVILRLERSGPVATNADDAQGAQSIIRPNAEAAKPVEGANDTTTTTKSPTNLAAFAASFEQAYNSGTGYDGKQGRLKIAWGVNSDPKSVRFGMSEMWAQRWSEETGTAVKIHGDKPVFYSPKPLSTHLITNTVDGLRNYTNPTDHTPTSKVFSGIDLDGWAKTFLQEVEALFGPTVGPEIADLSTTAVDLYNPLVGDKGDLASNISKTTDYIYDYATGAKPGEISVAVEVMRQALLTSLENDYGTSTVVQFPATITLHGDIEPDGDPKYRPNLYGRMSAGGSVEQSPAYHLSNAKLPLNVEAGKTEAETWLNFLVSATKPGEQTHLDLDLAYEIGFVEHDIQGDAEQCGYVPSSWLTFVLQQDVPPPTAERPNTLTADIGQTRIPIPLRAFPATPRLLSQTFSQNDSVTTIAEGLVWNYQVQVTRPSIAQDTLFLTVTFNDEADDSKPTGSKTVGASAPAAAPVPRPKPTNLFEALARYEHEYPQLASYLPATGNAGGPDAVKAVQDVTELISGVAATWNDPLPDTTSNVPIDVTTEDTWTYQFAIEKDPITKQYGPLTLTQPKASADGFVYRWPVIEGFAAPTANANVATYAIVGNEPPARYSLSWSNLFVLDYQSALTSARIERNLNLAPVGMHTNPAFVYRTATVQFKTPLVPLITAPPNSDTPAPSIVLVPQGQSHPPTFLEQAFDDMLTALATPPADSIHTSTGPVQLKLEGHIAYSFDLVSSTTNTIEHLRAELPIFLIPEGGAADGTTMATAMNDWKANTAPDATGAAVSVAWTLFATKFATETHLPLVQFVELRIYAEWWDDTKS